MTDERRAIDDAIDGKTVPRAFRATVRARGGEVALRWRDGDAWSAMTWREYADRAARAAAGLRALGVERGQRIVLMSRNRPEFHVVDMAALLVGAVPVSVYTSAAPDQLRFLASHSEAAVALAETPEMLARFLEVHDELSALRHLVTVDDGDAQAPPDTVPFARLVDEPPIDWEAAADVAEPDDLVTMIYTSGTTGSPKGVMITHRNACWTVESLLRAFGHGITGKRMISYLPMAHIAERMVTHYIHADQGAVVTTCPDTGLLPEYLRDVRPEVFFGVPRVWEKAHSTIESLAAADGDQQRAYQHAVDVGRRVVAARVAGEALTPDMGREHERAEKEVLSGLRELIGLDQCEVAVSAAAPIPAGVLEFFLAVGLPISELYGLSESCGPLTWDPYEVRPGTSGRPIPGCEVRLAADGEIVGRGGNIFAGYLDAPEKTAEAIDADGWLHTGDVGEFDADGYLRVVDRKKELIVTAGGENIAPANIESELRLSPVVDQAAVVGDRRPYLVALITLDGDVARAWAESHGIEATTPAELARNPEVRAEVQRAVDDANGHVFRIGQIKRFAILDDEWAPDSDELTATMKLKRRGIQAKYAPVIDSLYREVRA